MISTDIDLNISDNSTLEMDSDNKNIKNYQSYNQNIYGTIHEQSESEIDSEFKQDKNKQQQQQQQQQRRLKKSKSSLIDENGFKIQNNVKDFNSKYHNSASSVQDNNKYSNDTNNKHLQINNKNHAQQQKELKPYIYYRDEGLFNNYRLVEELKEMELQQNKEINRIETIGVSSLHNSNISANNNSSNSNNNRYVKYTYTFTYTYTYA